MSTKVTLILRRSGCRPAPVSCVNREVRTIPGNAFLNIYSRVPLKEWISSHFYVVRQSDIVDIEVDGWIEHVKHQVVFYDGLGTEPIISRADQEFDIDRVVEMYLDNLEEFYSEKFDMRKLREEVIAEKENMIEILPKGI